VEAAAIAVHEPTGRVGDEITERGHAVLERHPEDVIARRSADVRRSDACNETATARAPIVRASTGRSSTR